jgi:predicted transcriptional regulator
MSFHHKRRSKHEIIFAILKECQEPTLKTQLMFRANLSLCQLNEYLNFLEERGLIAKKRVNKKFRWTITEKGKEFIKNFKLLQNLIKPTKTSGLFI